MQLMRFTTITDKTPVIFILLCLPAIAAQQLAFVHASAAPAKKVTGGKEIKGGKESGTTKEAERLFGQGKFAEAISLYEKALQKEGNLYAAYKLGEIEEEGLAGKQDLEKAKSYFEKGAKGGEPNCAYGLAGLLDKQDSKMPSSQTIYWLTRAADGGVIDAQRKLGSLYSRGKNNIGNDKLCFKYRRMAADQGDRRNAYKVGMLLLKGQGVEKDAQKAAFYLKKAASDNIEACQILHRLYTTGEKGLPADAKQAEQWRLAANNLLKQEKEDNGAILDSLHKDKYDTSGINYLRRR